MDTGEEEGRKLRARKEKKKVEGEINAARK